jgi:hypothetical protein
MNRMSLLRRQVPTLALPRKRRRGFCVYPALYLPCSWRREWESRASPSELFPFTLLRLRGREWEGVHADEVIR